MSTTKFTCDKEFFEKKISLLTNLQLGFVGTALMLMMMDLSKIYLLVPLIIGLILSSWYKSNFEKIQSEVKDAYVEFAPKSLLFVQPATESEQRVTFRELEEIDCHKENFINVITLYLKDGKEKLQFKGFKESDQLLQTLSTHIQSEDNTE